MSIRELSTSSQYHRRADSIELVDVNWNNFALSPIGKIRSLFKRFGLEGDIVDIDNEIDWHESHVLLKAAFPLAASGPFATYEIPYGTIDRPTTRNN